MMGSMVMHATVPPCKDCTNRKVGCHGRCRYYIAFKKALELEKAEKRKADELNNISYIRDFKKR